MNNQKIEAVIDSIVNGQLSQAKRQIKSLTYDERVELIEQCAEDTDRYKFSYIVSVIVKRDFK